SCRPRPLFCHVPATRRRRAPERLLQEAAPPGGPLRSRRGRNGTALCRPVVAALASLMRPGILHTYDLPRWPASVRGPAAPCGGAGMAATTPRSPGGAGRRRTAPLGRLGGGGMPARRGDGVGNLIRPGEAPAAGPLGPAAVTAGWPGRLKPSPAELVPRTY